MTLNNSTSITVDLKGLDNSAAISTEATTRQTADTTLQTNINTEASTRATNDTTITALIDTEDTKVKALITAESNTRKANDETLQDNIDNETTSRADEDTAINTKFDPAFDDVSFTESTRNLEFTRIGDSTVNKVVTIPNSGDNITDVTYNAGTNQLVVLLEDGTTDTVTLGPVDNSIKAGRFVSATHSLILTKKDDTEISVNLEFLGNVEVDGVTFDARTNSKGIRLIFNATNVNSFNNWNLIDTTSTQFGPKCFGPLPATNGNITNGTKFNGTTWIPTPTGETTAVGFPVVNSDGGIISIDGSFTPEAAIDDIILAGTEAARISNNNLIYQKFNSNSINIFLSQNDISTDNIVQNGNWSIAKDTKSPFIFTSQNILTIEQNDTSRNVSVNLTELQIDWGSVILNGTPGTEGNNAVDVNGETTANYIPYTNYNNSTYYRIFNTNGKGETIRLTSEISGTIVATKTY